MTNLPSDEPRTFRRKPLTSSIKVVAKVARVALGLRDEEEAFELPAPKLDGLKATTLWDALLLRKTAREFAPAPIDLGAASDILYATFGAVHAAPSSATAGAGPARCGTPWRR